MKYKFIRWISRIVTWKLPLYQPGRAPIRVPDRFKFSHEPPSGPALNSLVSAYQRVFREAAYWSEKWSADDVIEKLRREVGRPSSFLVTMEKSGGSIVGFAWGEKIRAADLPDRIGQTLGKSADELRNLTAALAQKRITRVLYADEFGILNEARSGIDSVRGLLQPWLEWGWFDLGVTSALFWTTPDSPINRLALYMGFEPVLETEIGNGKKIVFLLNADFEPLLRICQNVDERQVVRLMRISHLILKSRRRRRKT
jgi:hypothetical protein